MFLLEKEVYVSVKSQSLSYLIVISEPHPPNQDLEGASIDLNTPYKQ